MIWPHWPEPLDTLIQETLNDDLEITLPILAFPLFNRLLNEHGLQFVILRQPPNSSDTLTVKIERYKISPGQSPLSPQKPVRDVNEP